MQDGAADVRVAGLVVLDVLRLSAQRRGTAGDRARDDAVPHAAPSRHQVRVRRLARLDRYSCHSTLKGSVFVHFLIG